MHLILTLLSRAGLNGFFLLMIAMVILARIYPEAGAETSPLHLKEIGNIGVAIIFFFYGLKLDPRKLKAGLGHWKLHLIIQGTTFLLFPVVIMLSRGLFHTEESDLLWIGAFYLAALPSTVSSSVVMVSIAGGNISAAIFNASVSSLLGIVLTPLWMSVFISGNTITMADLSGVILNLTIQILLPVTLGLLLHRKMGFLADRYKSQLRYFDQAVILIIIFRAFSESFLNDMFTGYSAQELVSLSALMLLLFFVMLTLMQLISDRMGFTREDRITIIFCGSKKSLVQGAVMGQVLFPDASVFGIVLLPLMLYHALQLLAGSIIAQRMANRQ